MNPSDPPSANDATSQRAPVSVSTPMPAPVPAPAIANRTFDQVLEIALRLALVVLIGSGCFIIIRPFVIPVLWAVIIASACSPLYHTILAKLKGRRRLASALVVVALCCVFLVPTIWLSGALISNARDVAEHLRSGALHIPPAPKFIVQSPMLNKTIGQMWFKAATDLTGFLETVRPQVQEFGHWLLSTLAGTGLALLQFFLAIIVSGVMLSHEDASRAAVHRLARRLAGERGVELVTVAGTTVRSVTRGVLGVAVLQAVLAGLSFVVVGIPAAGLWAIVCLVFAIIQVGLFPVLVPVSIYLFSTTSTPVAVGFLIWSILLGSLDNVLKPLLLGRGVRVPLLIVFMGTIGGLIAWGVIGLFVGSVGLVVGYQVFVAWLNIGSSPATAIR